MAMDVECPRYRHAHHILQHVRQWMEDNPDHLDVLIKLEDGLVLSHSLLLGAVSPFLAENLKGVSDPLIIIPNLSSYDLQVFFQSIFDNSVLDEHIPILRQVCQELRVPERLLPNQIFNKASYPSLDLLVSATTFSQQNGKDINLHGLPDDLPSPPSMTGCEDEPSTLKMILTGAESNNRIFSPCPMEDVLDDEEPRSKSPFFTPDDLQIWMNDTRHNANTMIDDPYEESLSSTPPPFSQDFDTLPFLSEDPVSCKKGLRKCHFCPNTYRHIRGRNLHMLSKHRTDCQASGILFDCDFCADHFITQTGRDRHLQIVHDLKLEDMRQKPEAPKREPTLSTPCLYCQSRFVDCQALRAHVKSNHPLNLLCCLMCGQPHESKEALYNHIQVHVSDAKNIFYTCKHCHTNFSVKYELRTHIRRQHMPDPTYICNFCGQGFFNVKYLENHISREHTHSQKLLLPCQHCDKKFRYQGLLDRHVRSHLGIKPFRCHVCEKKFSTNAILKNHQRNHMADSLAGRLTFGCSLCSLTFDFNDDFEKHLNSTAHKEKEVNEKVAQIIRDVKLANMGTKYEARIRHAHFILGSFHETKKEGDVMIKCSNGITTSHALFLASASELLRNYFVGIASTDLKDPMLILPDVSVQEFDEFADHCLVGNHFEQNQLPSVLKVLHVFQAEHGLQDWLESWIQDKEKPASIVPEEFEHLEQSTNGSNQCHFCPKRYRQVKARNTHMLADHLDQCKENGLFFKCHHCDMSFTSVDGRVKHENRTHPTSKSNPVGHGSHMDERLGNRFDNIRLLSDGTSQMKCMFNHDSCEERTFENFKAFKAHWKQVHPDKDRTCFICTLECTDREALLEHIQVHQGPEGRFLPSCDSCDKKFLADHAVILHKRDDHPLKDTLYCELLRAEESHEHAFATKVHQKVEEVMPTLH
ncbi:hypothetical protein TCAL_04692 [Tigriopus californicus]|uniref:C2H2-type domain-containing protein n=1 Tax=Tigriopus californicus TaxID=6832 RepID=A0A553NT22_TIGCA|nr:hypothetical protein TCAL_04692 [Tigriopus californicus]